ncbi:MAG: YicC family protein [Bacteroidaceae bacterium]|nr:YicC family protein [Bacteroidaceae bacterium]
MIQSMTGFGKADAQYNGKKIHVELRSLNSKSLDLSTRIASLYREKEMEVRKQIAASVERGKVDFSLWVERTEATACAQISEQVVAAYIEQIRTVSHNLGLAEPQNYWEVVMRLPEVTSSAVVEELTEEEWSVVSQTIDAALKALADYRAEEGRALEAKFREKLDNIERLAAELVPYEESRVQKIRQNLEDALANLKGVDYDRGRLEQELIYYIEKLDINEEKQRLAQHLKYFRETLDNGVGQGKKLGFIAQEMGREINTTGSKSNQAEMQNIVVGMKDELEQIKEQVLNVL